MRLVCSVWLRGRNDAGEADPDALVDEALPRLRRYYSAEWYRRFRVLRGGVGPAQPEWDDVETFCRLCVATDRDWNRAEFPDADASTRDNLDMLVLIAEAS